MNILKWIKDLFHSDLVKALGKEKNFTGAGVDTRYAAERGLSDLVKLHNARFALGRTAHLTKNNLAIPPKYREAIHKIASDGYEAAK